MKISDKDLMKGSDIQAMREILGAGIVEIYWVTGVGTTNSKWKLTGEESEVPIQDPTLSILTRFLSKYPEYSFMPKFPDFDEIFDMINEIDPELFKNKANTNKTSVRNFAPLFGKNSWSSSQWELGDSPSKVVLRLFLILKEVVEKEGKEGLKKYIKVVKEEVQARGLGSLEDLFKTGSWQAKAFREEVAKRYAEKM